MTEQEALKMSALQAEVDRLKELMAEANDLIALYKKRVAELEAESVTKKQCWT